MKEEEIKKYSDEDEAVELNIEDLTEIQGGIENDETREPKSCGLGCFIGAGSGVL